MMHPCNCSLFRLLVVMCIVLHGIGKATVALSNSCEVSRSTEQVVDGCPESEEEWREAAARKNCYAYSSQCSEPTRLVYHCVINPYVNQTLEVCAYAQNIVSGRCASYYFSGNLIKRNLRTKCSAFEEKPCPIFYRSDKAYNYPGCYELTKKSTTAAYITENTSAAVTTLTPKGSSNTYVDIVCCKNSDSQIFQAKSYESTVQLPKWPVKEGLMDMTAITCATGVILALIIVICVLIYIGRKKGKIFCNKHVQKDYGESNETKVESMELNSKTHENHHKV